MAAASSDGHAPQRLEQPVHPVVDADTDGQQPGGRDGGAGAGVDTGPGAVRHAAPGRGRAQGRGGQRRVAPVGGAEVAEAAEPAQRPGLRSEVLVAARPLDGRPHGQGLGPLAPQPLFGRLGGDDGGLLQVEELDLYRSASEDLLAQQGVRLDPGQPALHVGGGGARPVL